METVLDLWADLFPDPSEAAIYRRRSDLMGTLRRHVSERGLAEQETADLMGIDRGRVRLLKRGRFSSFPLAELIAMTERTGFHA